MRKFFLLKGRYYYLRFHSERFIATCSKTLLVLTARTFLFTGEREREGVGVFLLALTDVLFFKARTV